MVKNLPANAGDTGNLGLILELERSGEGHGNPLQYSCLENPMNGEVWWATVHGVWKSQTPLSNFTFFHFLLQDFSQNGSQDCVQEWRFIWTFEWGNVYFQIHSRDYWQDATSPHYWMKGFIFLLITDWWVPQFPAIGASYVSWCSSEWVSMGIKGEEGRSHSLLVNLSLKHYPLILPYSLC